MDERRTSKKLPPTISLYRCQASNISQTVILIEPGKHSAGQPTHLSLAEGKVSNILSMPGQARIFNFSRLPLSTAS